MPWLAARTGVKAEQLSRAGSAALDAKLREYIDAAYHDGMGGDTAQGVRWWIRFCRWGLGVSPVRVLDVTAPLELKLQEELLAMRFACWLVEERGVEPETARKYLSTVQAWHARRFGVRLAGGLNMARLPAMLKGAERQRGGKRPRRLRRGVRPRVLRRAMESCLSGGSAEEANWVAALTVGFVGLLRAAELALGPGKRWTAATCLTRRDVSIVTKGGRRHVVLHMRPCKNDKVERGKRVRLLLPGGGKYLDPVAALEHLFAADPVPEEEWAATPLFRDPATGAAFTTAHVRAVVKALMAAEGEDPRQYGGHSLRIGGATAALAAGVPPVVIRAMGRWSSDVYEIYCRASDEAVLRFGRRIAGVDYTELEVEFHEEEF